MGPLIINDQYFRWLDDLVEQGASSGRKYGKLTYLLFMKEFTWTVPNDGNRLEDGKILRDIFSQDVIGDRLSVGRDFPCSVLEVIIGVAKRMEDILYEPRKGDQTTRWLWMLLGNLDLHAFSDEAYFANPRSFEKVVDEGLQTFIDRTYDRKGNGGLFPLQKPRQDQRRVEIWYQMQEFLEENFRY